MPGYRIEQWAEPDAESSGNYELLGCDCTAPTGSAEEWLSISKALRGRANARFRRVSVHFDGRMFEVACPRNSYGPNDCCLLSTNEADSLAIQIERCLMEHREECALNAVDPIAMGI